MAAPFRGDVHEGYMSLASMFELAEKKLHLKVVIWMGYAHKGTKCDIHVASQSKINQLKDLKGTRIAYGGRIMVKTLLTHAAHLGEMSLEDVKPL